MEKNYEIGNFITTLRKEKKLTQGKLGELVGVSNKAISKWENGQGLPEPKYMAKLCVVLGITMEELFNGKRNLILDNEVLDDLSRLEHVYKYYNNDSRVEIGLKDITLNFKLGEIVALTGVSGSGKTTLINMIGGVDSFEDGEIYMNNEGISRYDSFDYENYRKKYISFIFQDYGILESYTILDNLILVRLLMNDSYKEAKEKAMKMVKQIGFFKFKHRKASKLSGGQKQKLSVARAILKDTPIILGDEITANLDSTSGKEILELLFNNVHNKLVLLVTHHYEQIEKYMTRRITLSEGKVIEDKKIKDVICSNYKEPTSPKKSKDILLGVIIACKKFKTNFLNQFLTLLSILLCAILLFGGNIFADYYISDWGYWEKEKNNEVIEVKKGDSSFITDADLDKFNEISDIELSIIPELYGDNALLLDNRETYRFLIDDSLSFGEVKISTNIKSNSKNTPEDYHLCSNYRTALYFKLTCIEMFYVENTENSKEDNIICLSSSTLNFIQKLISINTEFQIKDTDKYFNILSEFHPGSVQLGSKNFMEVDLTSSFEGVYVPKNYIPSEALEVIQEDSIVVWDNRFETSVHLTSSDNALVSYTFFENLELKLDSIYVICNLNHIYHVDDTLNSLGYHTFKLQNYNMVFYEDDSLFKANTTFFAMDIVLAILIYILLKVTYKKLLKARQKEFTILKKLGFSNKTIYIHMICPILISAILVLLGSGFIYLVRPFSIWYFYVIPLCSMGIVTYHVCKNVYIQYNSILKEVK